MASPTRYPKDIPVKFRSDGQTISGIMHLPSNAKSILIFANGFPDNIVDNHLVISSARYFSGKGFAFLRFNPRGRWPSKGAFTKMDVSDTAEDLGNAILFAKRKKFENVGLIGHSLGGLASILVPKEDVTAVTLWEPSSPKFIHKSVGSRKMKRQMKASGYGVNENYGFIMGRRMFEEARTAGRPRQFARNSVAPSGRFRDSFQGNDEYCK